MRRDVFRVLVTAACMAIAGCSTTGGSSKVPDDLTASPRNVEEEMTRTGLANVRLAQNYLATNQIDLALDRANRALKTDPDSAEALIVMGMVRERLGDTEQAGAHFLRAAKLAPDEGYVLNTTAVWLCQGGRAAEADVMFAKATKDPFYKSREQAFFNAGKCAQDAGDLAKAEAYLRSGIEHKPEDPRLLEQMVRLKVKQGDLMGARAFFQRREALGPPGPEMLSLAAGIEQSAGDEAAAARYRQRLSTDHPGYTPPAADGTH